MTATVPGTTPTLRQVVRRWRFWAIVLGAVVLLSAVGLLVSAGGSDTATFAPDNATPTGGRALAEVLGQQGVDVRSVTALDDAAAASGPLLVDDEDDLLTAADWARLTASRSRLIVVGPDDTALGAVLPGASAAGTPAQTVVTAGCDLALARRAGTMSLQGTDRSLRDADATVCFGGQLLTASRDGTRVILLADATPFTNAHIVEAGNAAVALNVLGSAPTLTWYRPDAIDLGGTTQTLASLTPKWVTPSIVLLLLSGLVVAFQRGRRLGPVVIERLPVVVRSRETVEGRARLYARGGARLRAADALRMGAIGRMAPMLGLAGSAALDEVVSAVAAATRLPPDAVREVLVDRDPEHDRALVALSDDLARLEAAVKAASVPGAERNGVR